MLRSWFLSLCAVIVALAAASWISAGEGAASCWRTDAYAAYQASQASGRPMLFYVTSANCPYCVLMERKTLSNPAVQEMLRQFEPARVYADRQPQVANNLRVHAYPTTVIVDANNCIVESITGYVEPSEFERRLAKATTVKTVALSR
jgi:thioredoxin-related protein